MNEESTVLKKKDRFKREMKEKGFKWVGVWLNETGQVTLDNVKREFGKDYLEINKFFDYYLNNGIKLRHKQYPDRNSGGVSNSIQGVGNGN